MTFGDDNNIFVYLLRKYLGDYIRPIPKKVIFVPPSAISLVQEKHSENIINIIILLFSAVTCRSCET